MNKLLVKRNVGALLLHCHLRIQDSTNTQASAHTPILTSVSPLYEHVVLQGISDN